MLKGIAALAGTSIVLCTATQPAWLKREDWDKGLENVREIVPDELNLFERLKRVNVEWPRRVHSRGRNAGQHHGPQRVGAHAGTK